MSDRERFAYLLAQPTLSLDEIPEFLSLIDKLDPEATGAGLLAAWAAGADQPS